MAGITFSWGIVLLGLIALCLVAVWAPGGLRRFRRLLRLAVSLAFLIGSLGYFWLLAPGGGVFAEVASLRTERVDMRVIGQFDEAGLFGEGWSYFFLVNADSAWAGYYLAREEWRWDDVGLSGDPSDPGVIQIWHGDDLAGEYRIKESSFFNAKLGYRADEPHFLLEGGVPFMGARQIEQ